MTAPVTIPDLDPAGPVDPLNDLLLIRQGLNDRKISAGLLANIRLGDLDMLPGQVVASDVLLIGRNNGLTYDNYILPPQYLGFLNGTRCWFYQASAPLGWTIIAGTGDRLLGVSEPGGSLYNGVNAPGQTGTWQQADHTLTIAEMPSHAHQARSSSDTISGAGSIYYRSGDAFHNKGNFNLTIAQGGSQPHNHGNTWRPLANVGILCTKDKLVGE